MNIILFSVESEGLPGGVLGPFQNCPMFPCSHTFSLFVPLLINLLTTYYRPQFPPAKKPPKNKTSICVTSSQAFERKSLKKLPLRAQPPRKGHLGSTPPERFSLSERKASRLYYK